ncbi:MAG TPA: terminase [Burkholderiaceae bacterium]|nr:terminase [Burkholderiaceae bacterium]
MSLTHILRTQWADYSRVHANGANLMVHALTAPVFMAGTVVFFWGFCALSPLLSLGGVFAMIVAVVAQGWGHKKESQPPAPFTSRGNAIARIFLEQWVTFPRYVVHCSTRRLLRKNV